jgi:ribosomal protein S27AE
MSPRKRAPWRLIYLSYPCPTCDAAPGQDCRTTNGHLKHEVHADRARLGNRCPKCGTLVDADHLPDQLCARCELVRALETERASKYQRLDP